MHNKHLIQYILERVEGKSTIYFMNKKGEYRQYTYTQLWTNIKRYAEYFKKQNVKEGDVVSILLPTCEEYLNAFFAIQLLKAYPVSLYPPTSLADLNSWTSKTENMLDSVNSRFVISNKVISPFCSKLRNNGKYNFLLVESINNFDEEYKFDIEKFSEDDIAFLQFSSGTTGIPKAISIEQSQAILNASIIADALPCEKSKIKVAAWLPLYHDMGLVGCLLMSIVNGTDLILLRPDNFILKPELWLKAISDFQVTCTTAPNFAYGLIQKRVSKDKLEEFDLSSMKAFLCGAEMVYEETMVKFLEHLKPCGLDQNTMLPVYGMAETTLAISFTDPNRSMQFLKVNKEKLSNGVIEVDDEGVSVCCVGEVLKTFRVKIVDEEYHDIDDNSVGQILVAGPCVTNGYYLNESDSKEKFFDGWLKTGDLGFFYKGELYICGRIKDTLIIRGRNFYPGIYEEKLYSIDGVRKGRVVLGSIYNDVSDTEEVVALVEAERKVIDSKKRQDKVISDVNKILTREGLPVYKVEILDAGTLLKTSSGKVMRKANIELWKKDKLRSKASFVKFVSGFVLNRLNLR